MRKQIEEVFKQYHKDVYLYLYGLTHDVSLSEDLTSEVFLEVIKSLSTFRGDANIKTWIFSIARHRWCQYLRKKNRSIETEELNEFIKSIDKSIEDDLYLQQVREMIYELLDEESERAKNIVMMRIDGFSFYEIGEKYNISENSARVIDFRVKFRIQQKLKKEGFAND